MARKVEKRGPGRPPSSNPAVRRVAARLPPAMAAALDAYLASQRPQPTDTAVLLVALEDFLRAKGFPPD
ncbi:MAG: hypothetical protein IT429_00860 [Gemmataceae bacterium]|nr:hypothetical protein [Gemmataceae bacterium]